MSEVYYSSSDVSSVQARTAVGRNKKKSTIYVDSDSDSDFACKKPPAHKSQGKEVINEFSDGLDTDFEICPEKPPRKHKKKTYDYLPKMKTHSEKSG